MTDEPHRSNRGPNGFDPTPLDTALAVLSDHHRRRIVTQLVDDSPRTVEEFVSPVEGVDRRRQEIALVHTHLPKLRQARVVEWDPDTGVVRRGPRFDAVEAVVTLLRSNQVALPAGWP